MRLCTKKAISLGVSIDTINEFIEHRKLKKSPLTQRAFDRAMKNALEASFRFGVHADQIIEATIDRGWVGINGDWLESHFSRSTRQTGLEIDLNDTTWAH